MHSLRKMSVVWSIMLIYLLFVGSGIGQASTFQDVNSQDQNALFINYLSDRCLIGGFPDGTFRPYEGLTRAQAAALLTRIADLAPAETTAGFTDVPAGHWAADNINAATSNGFLSGYPDGTFRPNAILTRAEGISLLLRLSKQPDPGVTLPNLTDVSADHWAARNIAVGIASKMVGVSANGNHFYPDSSFTRGDLSRALGILLTKDPSLYQTQLTGQLVVIEGKVSVTQAGSTSVVGKGDSIEVAAGDTIKTGPNTVTELSFPDGSGLRIEENTELTVKESRGRSYIKPDGSPGISVDWLNIDVKEGKLFGALASKYDKQEKAQDAMANTSNLTKYPLVAAINGHGLKDILVNKLKYHILAAENADAGTVTGKGNESLPWWEVTENKRVRVEVDMPWSVAAIRGTFWGNIVESSGQSSTSLLVGEGEVTSGGETVPLGAGQRTATTEPNTPPDDPAPMTDQDRQDWAQAGDWAQQRARDIQTQQETSTPPPPPAVKDPAEQPSEPPAPGEEQPKPEQPINEPTPPGIIDSVSKAIEDTEQDADEDNPGQEGSNGTDGDDDSETEENVSAINTPGTYSGTYTITENGTYGPESHSDLGDNTATINGVLKVNPGEDGEVTLQNIVAKNIKILSGDSNSITLDNVKIPQGVLIVEAVNQNNRVHVITKGSTSIVQTNVNSQVNLDTQSGSFGKIIVNAEGVALDISDEAEKIDRLILNKNMELKGNIDAIYEVNAEDEIMITYHHPDMVTPETITPAELKKMIKPRITALYAALNQVITLELSKKLTEATINKKGKADGQQVWIPEITIGRETYRIGLWAWDPGSNEYIYAQEHCLHGIDDISSPVNTIGFTAESGQYPPGQYIIRLYKGTVGKQNFDLVNESDSFSFPQNNTSPAFAPDYPKPGNIAGDSVELQVKINRTGYIYYLMVPTQWVESWSPSEIVDWNPDNYPDIYSYWSDYLELSADEEWSQTIENLAANTAYTAFFVATDNSGNQPVLKTVEFITPKEVSLFNAVDDTVEFQFPGEISDVYIDTSGNYFPVVELDNETKYKIWIVDGNGDYTMSLHDAAPVPGTSNVRVLTEGSDPQRNYSAKVYKGSEFNELVMDQDFTYSYSTFIQAGTMNEARQDHTATLLKNGKVLITGGWNNEDDIMINTAEIYDPLEQNSTTVGEMVYGQDGSTTTLLDNGDVLFTGGLDNNYQASAYAEIFNSENFTPTVTGMVYARSDHTATLLGEYNQILIAGGEGKNRDELSTAEIYTSTGKFEALADTMDCARENHDATLLKDGSEVLITGGNENYEDHSAEIFDFNTKEFTPTVNDMVYSHFNHTATLLNDGRVLITGGSWQNDLTAEIFYPETETFKATDNMLYPRNDHSATLLNDGRVLITGGGTTIAEIYDPILDTFIELKNSSLSRRYHTATLLNDGNVLITGGIDDDEHNTLDSAEIFQPIKLDGSAGGGGSP